MSLQKYSSREKEQKDRERTNTAFDLAAEANDDNFTYDMIMVFKCGDEKTKVTVEDEKKNRSEISDAEYKKSLAAETINQLKAARLRVDMYYSVQGDEIVCRIGASESRLREEAARTDYDLQLDAEKCMEYGRGIGVRLAQASNDPDIGKGVWLNLYGRYDYNPEHPGRQELYKKYDLGAKHQKSFFRSVDRIKLTISIVECDEKLGGAGLSTSKKIAEPNHPMVAFYPLHDPVTKKALESKWFGWKSIFKSPLDEIRDYYGEAIAFYFGFLGFYNRALLLPAITGLAFFIWQMVVGRVDVEGIPFYGILIALWATLFLEYWKRREAKYRIRWGMTHFLEKEQPRPEFKGTWKASPVDGKKVEVFPWHKKLLRLLFSQSVVWTLIGAVIASVIGIFFFRKVLLEWDSTWGTYFTAFINSLQIQLLNVIYGIVSIKLNDFENHKTDTEYENSLILKTFIFKFVNSYNSMFYIIFFKKNDDSIRKAGDKTGCNKDDCLGELQQQLGTIFISMIIVSNAIELLTPKILAWWNARQNRMMVGDPTAGPVVEKPKSQAEKEFDLEPYDSPRDDYDELIIQFGFVTLFVVAFPLAPLLALISNIVEARLDSYKLCYLVRRPEPRGAASIGNWYIVLDLVSLFAVISNALIISFETPLLESWTNHDEAMMAYVFIFSEHIILLIKAVIAYVVPDEPEELKVHLARQEYIVNVMISGMEEDEDVDVDALATLKKPTLQEFDWSVVAQSVVSSPHELTQSSDMARIGILDDSAQP